MNDYRTRIYARYASKFQGQNAIFEAEPAERWGKTYSYHFRGWLPSDRSASIVDVACGGGRLLHFFKLQGYVNLQGVDISPEQVLIARQVVAKVTEGSVIDFLNAHPAEFDLITGLDIIEHFHKNEVLEFLDACGSALKVGGRLILQTPNAETPWGTNLRYADFTHEVCFTPDALIRLLRLCGFSDIEVREQGPPATGYSVPCSLRFLLWRCVRQLLRFYNVIETGAGC